MDDRTVYILGRILGRMVHDLKVMNDYVGMNALHNPMEQITILHMRRMTSDKGFPPYLYKFIGAMFNQIDVDGATDNIQPKQQNIMVLGFESGRHPFDFETEMAARRITQQQLADKLGVSRMTVSRWLSNGMPEDRKCDVEIAIYSLSGKIGNGYDYIEPTE